MNLDREAARRALPQRRAYLRRYQNEWMQRRRWAWISENGPCRWCGSYKDLEVDHIHPETKSMQPARIWSRRKEVRDAELAKCQVLCHDCHEIKTAQERALGWEPGYPVH